MKILVATSVAALMMAGSAFAQGVTTAPGPGAPGGVVVTNPAGSTGDIRDVTVSPSGTGADTINTNSAGGSNAGQPSRGVPQGGSGGGSHGGG